MEKKRMKPLRRKMIVGVMIPVIVALIVLRRTMGMPAMTGAPPASVEALLLTGALFGIALSQAISVFRRPAPPKPSEGPTLS
jgi:hypothetical protein